MQFRAVILGLLALGSSVLFAGPAEASPLGEKLDAALRARGLRGARIGALVVSRADGKVLYARDADRPLIPASNQKILTALAALATFGPTHRFETEVLVDALPDAEGAVGYLAVRGGGDPALTSEDFWRLAADLRRTGLRRVRGDLILDASAFDGVRWHPSWGQTSSRAYHAAVSALTANYGAFAVSVEPAGQKGQAVRASIDPPVAYLQLVNRATTTSGRKRTLKVDRSAASGVEHVTVSGALPACSDAKTYYRSVLDPTLYAGSVLRLQLEANGIAVEGGVRVAGVPATAESLWVFEGKPLAEIVRLFMKFSNNAIAESLVKAMGAHESDGPGTWQTGLARMRRALAGLGIDTEPLSLVDGSGLSYDNRVTARTLVTALRRGEESFAFGPEFTASLPIASADGTLEKRAKDAAGQVRAKTGLLTRVTGLSGYAKLAEGERAIFSIVVNGYQRGDGDAMDAVDGFVAALVSANGTHPANH